MSYTDSVQVTRDAALLSILHDDTQERYIDSPSLEDENDFQYVSTDALDDVDPYDSLAEAPAEPPRRSKKSESQLKKRVSSDVNEVRFEDRSRRTVQFSGQEDRAKRSTSPSNGNVTPYPSGRVPKLDLEDSGDEQPCAKHPMELMGDSDTEESLEEGHNGQIVDHKSPALVPVPRYTPPPDHRRPRARRKPAPSSHKMTKMISDACPFSPNESNHQIRIDNTLKDIDRVDPHQQLQQIQLQQLKLQQQLQQQQQEEPINCQLIAHQAINTEFIRNPAIENRKLHQSMLQQQLDAQQLQNTIQCQHQALLKQQHPLQQQKIQQNQDDYQQQLYEQRREGHADGESASGRCHSKEYNANSNVDFISANKKKFQKTSQKKTYQEILADRMVAASNMSSRQASIATFKTVSSTNSSPAPSRDTSFRGDSIGKISNSGPMKAQASPRTTSDAEQAWARQSEKLKQAEKQISDLQKKRKTNVLRKYPSDSSVNTSHQVRRHQLGGKEKHQVSVDINLQLRQPVLASIPAATVGKEGNVLQPEQLQAYYSNIEQQLLALQQATPTNLQHPSVWTTSEREIPERRNSDSVRYSAPADSRREVDSPYNVLPPIQRQGETGSAPPHGVREDGYAARLFAQKKPEYRKYTINDFRNLQSEVQLGGLGPDHDNHSSRIKREKVSRQLRYAEEVAQRNRNMKFSKPTSDENEDFDSEVSKRQMAIEYAKKIKKPKAKENASEAASWSPQVEKVEKVDLQSLIRRHQRDKEDAARIG